MNNEYEKKEEAIELSTEYCLLLNKGKKKSWQIILSLAKGDVSTWSLFKHVHQSVLASFIPFIPTTARAILCSGSANEMKDVPKSQVLDQRSPKRLGWVEQIIVTQCAHLTVEKRIQARIGIG